MLNPWIRDGCPWKRLETRSITPGVSMLRAQVSLYYNERNCGKMAHSWLLKSFMMSRNLLYTSGRSENCILTWSR